MGMPRRDIAAQLKIAMPTLAIHITGACKRLGVETIVGVGRIWFSAKVGPER
jgi:DNA-binding CsgD family transcriptional regulator